MRGLRILMYHALGERDEAPERFVVPIRAFERQMSWLALLRCAVLRLDDAVRRVRAGERLPPRAVVLTFDDGTRDLLTLGLPVLQRHGFPATAFIVTRAMGDRVTWTDYPGLAGRPTLSWDDALALEPLVSIEPHTRTHPSLRSLDDDRLRDEIAGSRADLQERSGREHELFAYPYGHYDARVAEAVRAAGYTAAVSVKKGMSNEATPPYELRRYEIRGTESILDFLSVVVLSGARTAVRAWHR